MDEFELDLGELDGDSVVRFALACAERVATVVYDPDAVKEALARALAYLDGTGSLQDCIDDGADLRHWSANEPQPVRSALRSAAYALAAASDGMAHEDVLKAADCACAAADDWDAERAWQWQQLALALSPSRGKVEIHNRYRRSDLAERVLGRLTFWH